MEFFLLIVAGASLLIGKIALFMYLINLFKLELKLKISPLEILKGDIPKRFQNAGIPEVHIINLKRNILELQTLLWTFGIGEVVGYIFLFLTDHPKKLELILLNAIYLIVASLLCQVLTLLNAWFRIRTDLIIRLGFQFGLIILGLALIYLAKVSETFDINNILQLLILGYFFTSVLALVTMLLDALFFDNGTRPFDFNQYSRLVIILGLFIGSCLFFQL